MNAMSIVMRNGEEMGRRREGRHGKESSHKRKARSCQQSPKFTGKVSILPNLHLDDACAVSGRC